MRRAPSFLAGAVAAGLMFGGCSRWDPYEPGEHRTVAGGRASEAPSLMRDYGCHSCHTIPGVRGADARVGPPLGGFADRRYIGGRVRNEPDDLVLWILNPQVLKPGTAMPNLGVSGEHARHMAAYLYTLR